MRNLPQPLPVPLDRIGCFRFPAVALETRGWAAVGTAELRPYRAVERIRPS